MRKVEMNMRKRTESEEDLLKFSSSREENKKWIANKKRYDAGYKTAWETKYPWFVKG